MGGPSLESSRAAEEARRNRLASLRTRDGVVDLDEWRAALRAAKFLQSLHGRLPVLLGIRVLVSRSVGFELEVTIVRDDPMVRRCIPTAVNDVPVRVVARNPGHSSPSPSESSRPAPADR